MIKPFLAKSISFVKSFKSGFLNLEARLAFTKLKQRFIKALVLYYFDLECHICIETDAFGYTINKIFSQLTLNDLD